jgi:hypothetical protein
MPHPQWGKVTGDHFWGLIISQNIKIKVFFAFRLNKLALQKIVGIN